MCESVSHVDTEKNMREDKLRQDMSCAENMVLFAHGSEILPKRLCANKANSKLH